MNSSTLPTLLTPAQVAETLGVTIHTLSIWRCEKRYNLPYVKSGRLVRYHREHVEEFIKSRTHRS